MPLTTNEINRYSRVFITAENYKSKEDSRSTILNKIVKFELTSCNSNFNILDFKNKLFHSESFHDSSVELRKAIKSSDYVYIHSYGKNGKSTFIRLFLDSIDGNANLFFDFRANKKNIPSVILKEKIKTFYTYTLLILEDHNIQTHPFILFFNYIIDNYDHQHILEVEDPEIGLSSELILKLSKGIIHNLDSLIKKSSNGEFRLDKLKLINEIFRFLDNNIDDLFSILLVIKVYYEINILKKSDVFIVFDNLDDVYTYLPEEINNSYTSYIINFFENIKSNFPNIFLSNHSPFNITPKFIFIYRTSNYLSTLSSMYNVSDSIVSRVDLFDENLVKRVRITSVKDSPTILSRRLDFYKDLCDSWGIVKSTKYELLRNILKAFSDVDKKISATYDPSTVLRLWNGNKLSFVDFVLNIDISQNNITTLFNNKISSRIKTEIFFHYFIKYFHKKAKVKTPITNFVEYTFNAFNNDLKDKRCGLSRLFFTYVFNKRLTDSKLESVKDAFEKGVSLSDFIEDLSQIKINDISCYSNQDLKKLFECLFEFEIDNWGNFFSCCTPTTENDSIEKYKWVEDVISAINDPEKSKKIKFYNNDSAAYFMFQLRRSFEYFSYSTNNGVDTLGNSIFYQKIDNNIFYIFDKILLHVYKRIEDVCNITYNFFNKAFSEQTVHQYCNSVWAMHKRMYFDDLISRVIGYIEDVRYAVINELINIQGDYSKLTLEDQINVRIDINKIFVANIQKYLFLFFILYEKCKKRDGIIRVKNTPSLLHRTFTSFKHMQNIANKIETDPSDFKLRISTLDIYS